MVWLLYCQLEYPSFARAFFLCYWCHAFLLGCHCDWLYSDFVLAMAQGIALLAMCLHQFLCFSKRIDQCRVNKTVGHMLLASFWYFLFAQYPTNHRWCILHIFITKTLIPKPSVYTHPHYGLDPHAWSAVLIKPHGGALGDLRPHWKMFASQWTRLTH